MGADEYELLRERFRPERTRVLFVGESRPASGKFFYKADSTLEQHTQEAFGFEGSAREFLEYFKRTGCYLVDLCIEPVNALTPAERRATCRASEARLATDLRTLRPVAVIVVMKGIEPNVRNAIKDTGLAPVAVHVLPFPAMGHQQQYVAQLRGVLERLRRDGMLAQ